jgi:hypothetical protein
MASALTPKLTPRAADEGDSPNSSLFGAFGKSATFKAPLTIQIGSFTREDAGFVNYDIQVMQRGARCGYVGSDLRPTIGR